MSGAAPGAKLVSVRACLFIAGCTAHALIEGMIYAAEAAQRRRDQHVDRRPAGAQRRQQRARGALQPPDRAVQRADVHLGRQQRPGHEHDRRPVGRDERRERRLVHHRRTRMQAELRRRDRRSTTTCTTSRRAARARTAGSSRRSSRSGRGDLDHADVAAGQSGCPTRCRRATRCSTARRWPRRRRRARLRCCQRGQASRRAAPAGAAAPGAASRRPACSTRAASAPTSRATACADVGAAWNLLNDEHQDGRHHLVGAGQHGAQPASSRRPASASASTTARASTAGRVVHAHLHVHAHQRRRRQPSTYNVSWVGNDGTFSSPGSIALPLNVAGRSDGDGQPDDAGRPLGDPEPRRPERAGHRVPDDEHRHRGRTVHAPRTTTRSRRRARSAADQSTTLLLPRAGRRAGVQGRLDRARRPRRAPGRLASCAGTRTASESTRTRSRTATRRRPAACTTGSPTSRTTTNPLAGVWEVTVDARRTSDATSRRSR